MDQKSPHCVNERCSLYNQPQAKPDYNALSDMICPECHELLELPKTSAPPVRKLLTYVAILIGACLLGWGIYSLIKNHKSNSAITTENQIPDSVANKALYSDLTTILIQVSDVRASESDRENGVKNAMGTYFTPNFVVLMHYDHPDAEPRRWEEPGDGQKYLERLTSQDSIIGYKILRVEKDVLSGKISKIELVEYHKTI